MQKAKGELGRTRVLGNWQPSKLDYATIRGEFVKFLQSHGLQIGDRPDVAEVAVRNPDWHSGNDIPIGNIAFQWHKDCVAHDYYAAMWSNVLPTQILRADGTELELQAGDVVLVENGVDRHRAPVEIRGADRWFARCGPLVKIEEGEH